MIRRILAAHLRGIADRIDPSPRPAATIVYGPLDEDTRRQVADIIRRHAAYARGRALV